MISVDEIRIHRHAGAIESITFVGLDAKGANAALQIFPLNSLADSPMADTTRLDVRSERTRVEK